MPYYVAWGHYITLSPPVNYLGWLEWHVWIWNGKKFEDQGALQYSPMDRTMTIVTSSQAALKIRVVLKVKLGLPPAPDVPFTVTDNPTSRTDFIPLPEPPADPPASKGSNPNQQPAPPSRPSAPLSVARTGGGGPGGCR